MPLICTERCALKRRVDWATVILAHEFSSYLVHSFGGCRCLWSIWCAYTREISRSCATSFLAYSCRVSVLSLAGLVAFKYYSRSVHRKSQTDKNWSDFFDRRDHHVLWFYLLTFNEVHDRNSYRHFRTNHPNRWSLFYYRLASLFFFFTEKRIIDNAYRGNCNSKWRLNSAFNFLNDLLINRFSHRLNGIVHMKLLIDVTDMCIDSSV